MAKAKTKAQRKKAKAPQQKRATINPFRKQHMVKQAASDVVNESVGRAVRIVPVIETLLRRGDLTHEEYVTLDYYRQQALTAQRSPTRDSCDFSVRGGTEADGPSLAIISAKREVSRLESILGNLSGIVRAVCVEDISLTQWACHLHGSREELKKDPDTGKPVAPAEVLRIVPRSRDGVMFARWDLKFAARRMMK